MHGEKNGLPIYVHVSQLNPSKLLLCSVYDARHDLCMNNIAWDMERSRCVDMEGGTRWHGNVMKHVDMEGVRGHEGKQLQIQQATVHGMDAIWQIAMVQTDK